MIVARMISPRRYEPVFVPYEYEGIIEEAWSWLTGAARWVWENRETVAEVVVGAWEAYKTAKARRNIEEMNRVVKDIEMTVQELSKKAELTETELKALAQVWKEKTPEHAEVIDEVIAKMRADIGKEVVIPTWVWIAIAGFGAYLLLRKPAPPAG